MGRLLRHCVPRNDNGSKLLQSAGSAIIGHSFQDVSRWGRRSTVSSGVSQSGLTYADVPVEVDSPE